jgi:hypothetical protein
VNRRQSSERGREWYLAMHRPRVILILTTLLAGAWGCNGFFPSQTAVGGGSGQVVLVRLAINPKVDSLAVGETTQFAVLGTYSDSSTGVPAVSYTATGGTITTAGLYTAGTSRGNFKVIAKQPVGTIADTAAVTVK